MGLLNWLSGKVNSKDTKTSALAELKEVDEIIERLKKHPERFVLEKTEISTDIIRINLILLHIRDLLKEMSEKGDIFKEDDPALFKERGRLYVLEDEVIELLNLVISKRRMVARMKGQLCFVVHHQFKFLKLIDDSPDLLRDAYRVILDLRNRGVLAGHNGKLTLKNGREIRVNGLLDTFMTNIKIVIKAYTDPKFLERVKSIKNISDESQLTPLGVTRW